MYQPVLPKFDPNFEDFPVHMVANERPFEGRLVVERKAAPKSDQSEASGPAQKRRLETVNSSSKQPRKLPLRYDFPKNE